MSLLAVAQGIQEIADSSRNLALELRAVVTAAGEATSAAKETASAVEKAVSAGVELDTRGSGTSTGIGSSGGDAHAIAGLTNALKAARR